MSYHEKRNLISIISSVVIFALYSLIVYNRFQEGGLHLLHDLYFWATAFLIFIPVSIGLKCIITIGFIIVHKITTQEDQPTFKDERDKLIELQSTQVSHWLFAVGFFLAMGSVVIGMEPAFLFIIMALSWLLSDITGELTQFILYRRGF